MNDYVIGAGAVLTAGPAASIAGATLHAQTDPSLAATVRAALVDFESGGLSDLRRVVLVAVGWNARRVQQELVAPLLAREESTLADVLITLAMATGDTEVHVFARWLPDELLVATLRRAGITLVVHPIEAIRQAALISGQSFQRWPRPMRAA